MLLLIRGKKRHGDSLVSMGSHLPISALNLGIKLCQLNNRHNLQWLCAGDFNEIA